MPVPLSWSPICDICRRFARDAVDFIYSRSCVRCGEPLPVSEAQTGGSVETYRARFCPSCCESLRFSFEDSCQRCGAPVGPYVNTVGGCRHCRRDRFQFDRVLALGVYQGALAECCRRIKQPGEEALAAGLTELLVDAHAETWDELMIDLIVPVPHHWSERLSRGQMPPETMGAVLARRLKAPVALHILAKSRRKPRQSSLTPARRRVNLRDALRIAGQARLDGLTVLLTDDILTTGTTADRAAQMLKKAGAQRVLVAVLARGLGRSAQKPVHRFRRPTDRLV